MIINVRPAVLQNVSKPTMAIWGLVLGFSLAGLALAEPPADFLVLLEKIGVTKYAGALQEEGVDSAELLSLLTEQDLRDFKMGLGSRRMVQRWQTQHAVSNDLLPPPPEPPSPPKPESKKQPVINTRDSTYEWRKGEASESEVEMVVEQTYGQPGPCTIDRRIVCGPEGGSDCLSREQFERDYQGKRPVLLSGLIGDWPAMTRWTKRAFVEGYGTRVEVRVAPANSFSILAVSKLHP
jgi:hypothetical protein